MMRSHDSTSVWTQHLLTGWVVLLLSLGLGCSDDLTSPQGDADVGGDLVEDAGLDAAPDVVDGGDDGGPRDTDPRDGSSEDTRDAEAPDINDDWDFGTEDTGPPDLALQRITPSSGPVDGGTKFVVEGEGFTDETVLFFGSRRADVQVVDRRLVGQSPAGSSPGSVVVKAKDPDTGDASLGQAFTYTRTLSFDSVQPDAVPTRGGFLLTVRGSGFTSDTRVSLGGETALSHNLVDSETLRVLAPPHPAGLVDLRLTNRAATVRAPDAVEYVVPLGIDSIKPAAGPVSGGTTVTLEGRGFESGMTVEFGQNAGTVTSVNPAGTRARATTPPGSVGPVDVVVDKSKVESVRARDAYLYENSQQTGLTVASVRPDHGPASGGTPVMLVGYGLGDPDLVVTFGSTTATIQDQGPGFAVVTAPPSTPGLVDVTVSYTGGGTSSATKGDAFEYVRALEITSVQPNRGPAAGGTSVTISGDGFNGTNDVRFGGVSANYTVQNDSTIQATAPAHAAGAVDVVVERQQHEARREYGFTYTEPLKVYGANPLRGSVAGGTYVLVRGQGFLESNLSVTFGGQTAATTQRLDAQTLAVRSPAGQIGSVDIAVTQDGTTVKAPEPFTYFNPASRSGGSWGGEIAGSVNISVYSEGGAPIDDAYVMLAAEAPTSYSGRTDQNGMITFSGPEIYGRQTVSATAANFSVATIQRVDATNITIHLTRLSPPDPPPMDAGVPDAGDAGVSDVNIPDVPPIDVDVGGGGEGDGGGGLPDLGPRPDVDNPPPPPPPPPQGPPVFSGQLTGLNKLTVPGPGEREIAFVYTTRADRLTPNPSPGPNNRLTENGTYSIETRTGDLALVALGGFQDLSTGEFTATRMGVKRFQVAVKGETYERDIDLNIRLDEAVTLKVPNTPFDAQEGPDVFDFQPWLDFGSEGVFGRLPAARGTNSLLTASGYPPLTGPLSGVEVDVVGGAYLGRGSALTLPYSIAEKLGATSVQQTIAMPPLLGVPHAQEQLSLRQQPGDVINFQLTAPEPPDIIRVQAYDRRGRIMFESFVPGTSPQVKIPAFPDFSGLPDHLRPEPYPPGLYTLRLVGIDVPNGSIDSFNFTDVRYYKLPRYTLDYQSIQF
jgi:hypothetical protein